MIRFGWLSIVLLIGTAQGAIVAILLLGRTANREANRLLAALTFAFGLRVVPYIIGYAGFYDAYPWLSFAPFSISLIYGPLIYLYVARVTRDEMPRRWWLHLVPALAQLVYYVVIFVQPLPFKNRWDDAVHEPFVDPVETVLTFASLAIYLVAAFRRYREYRTWLDDATSVSADHQLVWLRNFLVLFAATVGLATAFDAYSAFVHHLNYYNFFALYAWYAALVYYLGIEGWRNAGHAYPIPAQTVAEAAPRHAPAADWRSLGASLRERVERGGYWRDPDLTLATLATQLEMPQSQLSRIVNDGLEQNFNEMINRMRVDAVRGRLADTEEARDFIEIAFEAGFSSKASFNRSFKAYTGTTPSEFRRSVRD